MKETQQPDFFLFGNDFQLIISADIYVTKLRFLNRVDLYNIYFNFCFFLLLLILTVYLIAEHMRGILLNRLNGNLLTSLLVSGC